MGAKLWPSLLIMITIFASVIRLTSTRISKLFNRLHSTGISVNKIIIKETITVWHFTITIRDTPFKVLLQSRHRIPVSWEARSRAAKCRDQIPKQAKNPSYYPINFTFVVFLTIDLIHLNMKIAGVSSINSILCVYKQRTMKQK